MTDLDPNLAGMIRWGTIPGGIWGTQITLETMASLARAGSRDVPPLVASIVPRGGDVPGIVFAFDRFLRHHFVYREERDEVLRDVPFMLNDLVTLGHMEGDCDDMMIMGSALLCSCLIPARFTAIQSENPAEFDHVFTEAKVNGEWVPMDPTVPYGTRYTMFGFMSEVVC